MPFGLVNAPSSFQRLLDHVLAPLKYNSCLGYIDDIVMFSRTFGEHLEHLEKAFKRLADANLRLKPSECEFALEEILYLGHVISRDGQKPDEKKVIAVTNFQTPICVRDVRSFVALCSYYRKFIKDFSIIAKPLTDLARKDQPFLWTDE